MNHWSAQYLESEYEDEWTTIRRPKLRTNSYPDVTKKTNHNSSKNDELSESCPTCKNTFPKERILHHKSKCSQVKERCPFCKDMIDVACTDIHLQYCPGIDNRDHSHHNTVAQDSRSSKHKGAIPKNTSIRDMMKPRSAKCRYCNTHYNVDILPNHEGECIHMPIQCDGCGQEVILKDMNSHKCKRRKDSAEKKNQYSTIHKIVPASIINKKNKYQELSSLDAKEKKNQSSTTQVDVPESIIDKENPKYQELSSLDAKGPFTTKLHVTTAEKKEKKKDLEDQELSSLDMKDVSLLTESMKELLMKSKNHDVKIIVKDKEFQAHRLILSARSRVFAMMLNHDTKESNTGTITIEDCDPDSFDEFLLYLYSGRTEDLTPNKALHLYYTADKYDLPALKKRCAILLKKSLSVESICDIVILAAKHDEKELLEAATEFFARNIRKILQTVNWQKFLSKNPVEGNELYIKSLDILLPINEE